jgi:hypothetical protein
MAIPYLSSYNVKFDSTYKHGLAFDKNGCREVVSGTEKLKGVKGACTIHIKAVSPTDRNIILESDFISP